MKHWGLSVFFHLAIYLVLGGIFVTKSIPIKTDLPEVSLASIQEKKLPPITQAISVSSETLGKELAFIQSQEQAHLREQEKKIKQVSQLLDTAKKEKKKTETEVKKIKQQVEKIAEHKQKLITDVSAQEQKKLKIEKEIIGKKKEISKIEKIHQLKEELFQESIRNDPSILNNYRIKLAYHMATYWKLSQQQKSGLKCILDIQMIQNGDVVKVAIKQSSGNGAFDQLAVSSVYKASPLPVIEELPLAERPRKIVMTFLPEKVHTLENFA